MSNALNNKKNDDKEVILGVNEEKYNKTQTTFETSDDYKKANSEVETNKSNFNDVASKENIVSNSNWNKINSNFVTPSAVTEADAWLSNQLQIIQSGKTSYSDQLKDMMDKILNREKFSYDVDTDPLFQQALASAMNSGKLAMQDTIGQASALTGGYGSTYATTAGNQAYNSYIEDAYDNLPQYYQMAMEAYQMEGDELYKQYSMLSDADNTEYNRNVTAYDATYQYRNQLYNEAYSQYRDSKSDAFASANLQLNENSQLVDNAYKMYQVSSDYADKMYEREYTQWADSINQAWKEIEMLNTDARNNKNFDESVRQYEQTFAEDVRQFDMTYAQNEDHFTRNLNFQASENAKDRAASSSSGSGSGNLLGLFANEAEANKAMSDAAKSQPVAQFKSSILNENEFNKRGKKATSGGNTVQYDNYQEYVEAKLDEWYNNGKGTLSRNQYIYLLNLEW